MIESTDLAYAAGYIDGDGCFHISKLKSSFKYRASLIIVSVNFENLEWFKKKFGGSISTKVRKKNHRTMYHFVFHKTHIKEISEFLVEKKKEFSIFNSFRNGDGLRDDLIREMKAQKDSDLIHRSIKDAVESVRNTVQPSDQDFAYLAGFVDSECCLGIQKYRMKNRPNFVYKILLQCNNSKFPCFYWISERFGGQFHFIDRSDFESPHRNQMTWRLSAKSLYPVLERIIPFLKHKKTVCEELIKFYKTTFTGLQNPSPNSPEFTEFYRPILEERERIFHKVKLLNKKGT